MCSHHREAHLHEVLMVDGLREIKVIPLNKHGSERSSTADKNSSTSSAAGSAAAGRAGKQATQAVPAIAAQP
jgi:hypothetical protein